MDRQTDRWTDRQTDRQMDRQTEINKSKETDRKTDRQTDIKVKRHLGRETDNATERERGQSYAPLQKIRQRFVCFLICFTTPNSSIILTTNLQTFFFLCL